MIIRYFNIGTTYVEAGNFRKGIYYLNLANNYFLENTDLYAKYIVAGYTNIGVAYKGLNVVDSSMMNYQKAISIAQNSSEKCYYGGTLLNIAEFLNVEGNPEQALNYLDEAIIDFKEENNLKGVWHVKYEIAHSYFLLNRIDDATILLEEVILHFEKTNDLAYLEKINSLTLKLNSSFRISNELENFQSRVEDVYSNYFMLLDNKYSDLTHKEKRLCALLN